MRALYPLAFMPILLAGCAIHPLPEDVSGYRTEDIVKHVRCEMRAALRTVFVEYLSRTEHSENMYIHNLLLKLHDNTSEITKKDLDGFDIKIKKVVDRYRKAGIAYNFTFNILENIDKNVGMDFFQAFTGAGGTLSLSASDKRSRQNVRSFTITDTPERLFFELDPPPPFKSDHPYCANYVSVVDDRYPVTGNVGLEETVRTFVTLSLFDSLGKEGLSSGPPTMSDDLTFTTTVTGMLAPKIALAPVRHGLADIALSASAGRTDIHKLVIGLSVPNIDETAAKAGRKARSDIQPGALISAKGSPAELNAAVAVSQSILRFDLRGSTIIINGDGTLAN